MNEIMLQEASMNYLGASINDTVTMYLDFSYDTDAVNTTSSNSNSNSLHSMLALAHEAVYKEPLSNEMHAILGADKKNISEVILVENFTVVASYEAPVGKFAQAYGNVALIDCHYIFDYMFEYARTTYSEGLTPAEETVFNAWIDEVEKDAAANDITMCNFGFTIEGFLDNQVEVYMEPYNDIVSTIQKKATLM